MRYPVISPTLMNDLPRTVEAGIDPGRQLLSGHIAFSIVLTLASLWNLMAGYAGLVSVGQQALGGLSSIVAIAGAGVLGALISIPLAALIFRRRGAYFAIGTWVIAEIFRLSFAQVSSLGGGSGSSLPD